LTDVSTAADYSPGDVAQSVLAVIGSLQDPPVTRLPSMGGHPGAALPEIDDALQVITDTSLLTGPVKLELLDRVRGATGRTRAVEDLAKSLVRPDRDDDARNATRDDLLTRLEQPRLPGRDPLNRSPADLLAVPLDDEDLGGRLDIDEFFMELTKDLRSLLLIFDVPDCDAEVIEVGTTPALSITTEAWSTQPLKDFTKIANPLEWPKCKLQHMFFRHMDPIPNQPATRFPQLKSPDHGWQHTLQEKVDFSLGLGWAKMTTDLDVVYFDNDFTVGCTYDWKLSHDGRITVDQGYVLVEDDPDQRQCRVRTLKQVHFAIGDLPPSFVCPIWGPATMLIAWACMPKEPRPRSGL
jgi:hypothetical protein